MARIKEALARTSARVPTTINTANISKINRIMKQSRMQGYLDTTSSLAVILGAIIVSYVSLWSYFHRSPELSMPVGLQKGNFVASLPKVNYQESRRTLLIAINTECEYCQQSAPFYKQLADLQETSANGSRIVAIFPNSTSEVDQFLQKHH